MKFRSGRIFTILITPLLLNPLSASAELNCRNLDGVWKGSMRGKISGNTSMTIKNCRLNWKLPDGRINICRYKERGKKIEYSCSLGSRGIVKIGSNRIKMQNTYTARKHGAYTVNLKKSGG